MLPARAAVVGGEQRALSRGHPQKARSVGLRQPKRERRANLGRDLLRAVMSAWRRQEQQQTLQPRRDVLVRGFSLNRSCRGLRLG
eukprot:1566497-Pleurochrysis_carterae.AAC.1